MMIMKKDSVHDQLEPLHKIFFRIAEQIKESKSLDRSDARYVYNNFFVVFM